MWWRKLAFGEGGSRFFGRGDVKFVILDLLKDQPKHGYEIMKDIEGKVGGFYASSPGSVYPTLQMLEDQGYITSSLRDGKKVYEITTEGRKFLEDNQETIQGIERHFRGRFGPQLNPETRAIFWELHDLAGTLVRQARRDQQLQPEQLRQIREVLSRARREVEDILAK
jgi:DNA-binding PadR family transcriptional regulator